MTMSPCEVTRSDGDMISSNMKTIAITIEEDILQRIDELTSRDGVVSGNRSRFIREAVREHLSRVEGQAEDKREREIINRHRKLLQQEALALIKEQAKL